MNICNIWCVAAPQNVYIYIYIYIYGSFHKPSYQGVHQSGYWPDLCVLKPKEIFGQNCSQPASKPIGGLMDKKQTKRHSGSMTEAPASRVWLCFSFKFCRGDLRTLLQTHPQGTGKPTSL